MPIVFDDEEDTSPRIVFDDEPVTEAFPKRKGPAPKQRSYDMRNERVANTKAMEDWNKLPWYSRMGVTPDELRPGGTEARNTATAAAAPILAGMAGQAVNPETYWNAYAGGINSTADLLTGRAPGETQTIPQARFLPGGDALREATAPFDETIGDAIGQAPPVVQKLVGAAQLPLSIAGVKGAQGALAARKPQTPKPIRTADELRTAAVSELGKATGQRASLNSVGMDRLFSVLSEASAGVYPKLHPKALTALEQAADIQGPLTIERIEALRRAIRDSAVGASKDDARIVTQQANSVRDFLNTIREEDVTGGDTTAIGQSLAKYRKLYQHAENSDLIDELVEKAEARAAATPGMYLHKAMQAEVRKLTLSKNGMRGLPKDLQEKLRSLAESTTKEKLVSLLKFPASHPFITASKAGALGLGVASGSASVGDKIASGILRKRISGLSMDVRNAAPDTSFDLAPPPGTTEVRPAQGELFPNSPDTSPGAGSRTLDSMEAEALRQQLRQGDFSPTQEFDFGGMEAPEQGIPSPYRLPGKRPSEQSRLLEQPEPNTDKGAYAEGAMAPSDIAARLKRARTRSEYRYVPAEKAEDGLAKVMSRNGYTLAEDLGDGRLMVKNTTTRPEARGKGEATGRYKELISSAAAEGKQVVSGTTLTSGAQRVIARLNREGFVEKINPYRVNEKNGSWYSTDPRVPIIEFRKPQ